MLNHNAHIPTIQYNAIKSNNKRFKSNNEAIKP